MVFLVQKSLHKKRQNAVTEKETWPNKFDGLDCINAYFSMKPSLKFLNYKPYEYSVF